MGDLLLGETQHQPPLPKMLAQGLGLKISFLWFQCLKPNGGGLQKSNASLQLRPPGPLQRKVPNARLAAGQIGSHVGVDGEARRLLRDAITRLRLSARGHHRVLKVARTIADLEGSARVRSEHIAESLRYRSTANDGLIVHGEPVPAETPKGKVERSSAG